jgi:peptide/nickel transport system permease protein
MSAVAAARGRWVKSSTVILRSRLALLGMFLVLSLVLVAVFAPLLAPYDPLLVDLPNRDHAPNWTHSLGTDTFGRDILSRVLWGSRLSLALGLGSVAIGGTVGVLLGLISGYASGWFDAALMRIADVFIAFRLLLLAIMVMAILGPGLANTVVAIGISLFAEFARLTRGEVLGTKEREFVEAARATGARELRIAVLHILPNIIGPLIVIGTLRLGEAILAEAALSFLGLGAGPPTPSWGLMVYEGLTVLRPAPWVSVMPSMAIMLTVLGFNLLGDGLRDAFDPKLRGETTP